MSTLDRNKHPDFSKMSSGEFWLFVQVFEPQIFHDFGKFLKFSMYFLSGSVEFTNCVRECMSPICYEAIYGFDELEPGEVDVRYTSFKGCFTKERTSSMSSGSDENLSLVNQMHRKSMLAS